MESFEKKYVRIGDLYLRVSNISRDDSDPNNIVYNIFTDMTYIDSNPVFCKKRIVPIDGTEQCVISTTNTEDSEEITKEKFIELFEETISYYINIFNDNIV